MLWPHVIWFVLHGIDAASLRTAMRNLHWTPEERERIAAMPRMYLYGAMLVDHWGEWRDHPACKGDGCDAPECHEGIQPFEEIDPVGYLDLLRSAADPMWWPGERQSIVAW